MPKKRNEGALVAFIVIGAGMVVVGITTEVWGLLFGGLTFIIIGVASMVGARRSESDKGD